MIFVPPHSYTVQKGLQTNLKWEEVMNSVEQSEMEQIYDKYHESVFRLAFAYCKNHADAEDITSEVFLKRFACKIPLSDTSILL